MTYHEILNILLLNWKKIFSVTLFSTIFIFLILLFVYPVTYKSVVTILPPEDNSRMNGLESFLGGQDYSYLLMGSNQNANPQLFAEILRSRTAALEVVKKFNMAEYYGSKNEFEAAKKLDENLSVGISKERIISLSVDVCTPWFPLLTANTDSIKKFAADLSNYFVKALDKINREKLSSKAKRSRIFLENQIRQTKSSLDSAESRLMIFQKKNKAVALPEQLNASIKEAAAIRAEIMNTEIEIGMLRSNVRENNKSLLALKDKLIQLNDQYNKMEMGSRDYLTSFGSAPELGKELTNLVRDVKIQNEVYLMLQQQYYKEKIEENRDLPTVQILDPAIPPLKASAPRIIISSFFGGIIVFLFISLIILSKNRSIFNYVRRKENSVV